MIRYYPANRVKPNQKAKSGEFQLNGKEYKGDYYATYDGVYYTGKSPVTGPSEKLVRTLEITAPETQKAIPPGAPNELSVGLRNLNVALNTELSTEFKLIQPYYLKPTEDDYKRRSIMRYFAKKRDRPGFITEVDKAIHDSLKTVGSEYDYVNYEAISSLWQLVGPLYDDRTNKQYVVAGIIDTNKRLIEAKDPGFPGLIDYIGGDYTKFARPTTK